MQLRPLFYAQDRNGSLAMEQAQYQDRLHGKEGWLIMGFVLDWSIFCRRASQPSSIA